MPTLTLKGGVKIPVLGFGTWKLQGDECTRAVLSAFEAGFRHIDTADSYANHQRISEAIKKSGLKRGEIFLTTKLWHEKLTAPEVKDSINRFLTELDCGYIDLLLIHWPNRLVSIEETLGEMSKFNQAGLIKAMGVSNFTVKHLDRTLKTGFGIAVNQVELHPSFNQKELLQYCNSRNLVVEAHSPNGQGRDLLEPIIIDLARKHFASEYQIILAWLRHKKIVALPKSTNLKHLKENIESVHITLDTDEIKAIDSIKQKERLINYPFSEFDD